MHPDSVSIRRHHHLHLRRAGGRGRDSGLWYARWQASAPGLRRGIWNLGIYMIFGALIVSKLWLVLSDLALLRGEPGEIFSIATFQSAGTFYGGLFGGIADDCFIHALSASCRFCPCWIFAAAALPLGHAIGRLGCFAAGCCFGKPTALALGRHLYDRSSRALAGTPLQLPLHPTQLYEAAAEFLNFLLLVWLGGVPAVSRPNSGRVFHALRDRARHYRIFPRRSRAAP